MADPPVVAAIREYLYQQAGLGPEDVDLDTPLFSSGKLDSLQLAGLIVFVEERFGVRIEALEVSLEGFDTVRRVAESVTSRLGA